jgi:hypothetical protein
MSAAHLLEALTRRGATLWAEGGRVRCRGPKSVVTPEVVDKLREHKADLLHALAGDRVSEEHSLECSHIDCSATGPKYAKIHNVDEVLEMARARYCTVEDPVIPPALPGRDPMVKRDTDKARFFQGDWRKAWPEDFEGHRPREAN